MNSAPAAKSSWGSQKEAQAGLQAYPMLARYVGMLKDACHKWGDSASCIHSFVDAYVSAGGSSQRQAAVVSGTSVASVNHQLEKAACTGPRARGMDPSHG